MTEQPQSPDYGAATSEYERGWSDALDAVIDRGDEGNEFGPRNFLLLRRIVAAVRIPPPENDRPCPACQTGDLATPHARKCPAWDEDGGL